MNLQPFCRKREYRSAFFYYKLGHMCVKVDLDLSTSPRYVYSRIISLSQEREMFFRRGEDMGSNSGSAFRVARTGITGNERFTKLTGIFTGIFGGSFLDTTMRKV